MATYDAAILRRLRKTPLEKPIAMPPRVMNEDIPAPYRKDFFGWLMGHKPDLAFINNGMPAMSRLLIFMSGWQNAPWQPAAPAS